MVVSKFNDLVNIDYQAYMPRGLRNLCSNTTFIKKGSEIDDATVKQSIQTVERDPITNHVKNMQFTIAHKF